MKTIPTHPYGTCNNLFIGAALISATSLYWQGDDQLWLSSAALLLACAGLYTIVFAIKTPKQYLRRFRPWDESFKQAESWLLMGIMSEWLSFIFGYAFVAIVFGVIAIIMGRQAIHQGNLRSFGDTVEKKAIKAAKKLFKDCRIQCDCYFDRVGNIDMIITPRHRTSKQRIYVVEIKSWHGLRLSNGNLVKMNGQLPYGYAIEQVNKQIDAVKHSRGVIWLPNAKKANSFYFKGILIVNGDAKYLYEKLMST